MQAKLVQADRCQTRDEEKIRELVAENSKLQLDLAAIKQKSKCGWFECSGAKFYIMHTMNILNECTPKQQQLDLAIIKQKERSAVGGVFMNLNFNAMQFLGEQVEAELEAEVDSLKAQLGELKERSFSAESSLYDTQTMFKTNLKELQEKAAMLSSALDREVEAKNDVIDELSRVRTELQRVVHDQRDLKTSSSDKEKTLSQQLAEAQQNNAVLETNLKNAKYVQK